MTLIPATSAQRKRKQRDKAFNELQVSARTVDLTSREFADLRRYYRAKYGHDWTLTARRVAAAKAAAAARETVNQFLLFADGTSTNGDAKP